MPRLNDQGFYYGSISGRLMGNKAREHLILKELEGLGKKDRFLEVGCAQGHFEKQACKRTAKVFGADCDKDFLEKAKKNCKKAAFVEINAERLPFKANSFDFVLCTEVLEHVPDWKKAFRELQRVSKKKILVTVPLEKGYFWRTVSRYSAMGKRGHLHALDSSDLLQEKGKQWGVSKYELVATPSRKINRFIKNRFGERLAMYAMMVFEKKGKEKE